MRALFLVAELFPHFSAIRAPIILIAISRGRWPNTGASISIITCARSMIFRAGILVMKTSPGSACTMLSITRFDASPSDDETRHTFVGHSDRAALSNLFDEQRNHRSPRARDVAETRRGKNCLRLLGVEHQVGGGNQPFAQKLGRAHHIRRAHGLVGRGEDYAFDAPLLGDIDKRRQCVDIDVDGAIRAALTGRHMFECRTVKAIIIPENARSSSI